MVRRKPRLDPLTPGILTLSPAGLSSSKTPPELTSANTNLHKTPRMKFRSRIGDHYRSHTLSSRDGIRAAFLRLETRAISPEQLLAPPAPMRGPRHIPTRNTEDPSQMHQGTSPRRDDMTGMTSPSKNRPFLLRQHSRVPGGFETDDDLSPIKTEFMQTGMDQDISSRNLAAVDTQKTGRCRDYVHCEDGQSPMNGNDSIVDEREMGRRLMDVESSFLPELSPVGPPGRPGSENRQVIGNGAYGTEQESLHRNHTGPPATPMEAYPTSAPEPYGDLPQSQSLRGSSPAHANTSSLETMSSSPTAAAAARTVSRVISLASIGGYETAEENHTSEPVIDESNQFDGKDATPKNNQELSSSSSQPGSPTPTKAQLATAIEEASNGDIDEDNSTLLRNPRRRPKFLNSRQASQRSSYSSYTSTTTTSTEGGSDLTVGAEYAMQTGGAMPYRGSRPPAELSRSISLGSMASGVSNISDGEDILRSVSNGRDSLQPLPEEGDSSLLDHTSRFEELSLPLTPTPTIRLQESRIDDNYTPRMRDSEVPNTVRGRKDGQNTLSPDRRIGFPTPATSRSKNLTLKEQSSTIDKLQKENWDLKLKIKFQDDLINQRSEEGVKAIMSENVNLRTDKVKARKEIRELKSMIRELEFRLKKVEETKVSKDKDQQSPSIPQRDGEAAHDLENELVFLRERVMTYEVEVEKLKQEGAAKDGEKRRLAEVVKSISEKNTGGSDVGVREELDMWKDLLETETARREQADEANAALREEIWRMKADAASTVSYNQSNSGQNTAARRLYSSSMAQYKVSRSDGERNGIASAASSTLVEQLRHENAELRREVGAQTSMLTSRNREKERLYQEIEDLKIGQRRGDGSRSVAGDSILDRSASRAHGRSTSRASDATRITQMSDAERETFEIKNDELRDQISELKLQNQTFLVEMEKILDELEQMNNIKIENEKLHLQIEDITEQANQDILTMQRDRDEALELHEDAENSFKSLKEEAQQRIYNLEEEVEQKSDFIERLETELRNSDEMSNTLRNEVRMLSEGLNRVEAEVQGKIRRIQEVELENEDINRELEVLEKSLFEVNGKSEKLAIELESRQSECAFLREEQDGCMLKIGDLEAAIKVGNGNLDSEKDRTRDLEARLAEERHQREVVGSKEKKEVQKMLNDLNRELSTARDDIRKLKSSLDQRELEVITWKERLVEYETSLRETLGDTTGSKSSLLTSISRLQNGLESTTSDLDKARHALSEKERLLQRRDELLESHGLESQKLSELLEKERAARRADKAQHEQWQKSHQHTTRTVSQKESRIAELEAARQSDRKKLTSMELQFKDQLLERNNLLLSIWHRLATMCGTDWQHQNSLVSGHLPTVEVVSNMLPGFSKNLLLALKTVDALISGFRNRIRGIERDLMKDFQALEHNLDMRIKRLDRLETAVQVSRVSGAASAAPEIAKLRGENRVLKAELAVLQKQDMHSRATRPESKGSTGERGISLHQHSVPATLVRHHSTSEVEVRANGAGPVEASAQSQAIEPSQQRWIYRLRELERRLKAEREARLLDRSGARKRLEEERAGAEDLRKELEREKARSGQ